MAGSSPDAFEAALSALRVKERTTAELAALLERRGYHPQEVADAISRLADAGELDDARFARRYAEDKRELRGWGPERIRAALEARGVPSALGEAALEADTHEAQVGRARELLEARARPLGTEADRARALGFLARRGYDYEIAHEAIRRAIRG
ncbi:MAG TPA: regulatory protein RecX [Solirubrobacterales bacterium]|nr:regulatory protein RecX [Solirubrobacterales bacterium]